MQAFPCIVIVLASASLTRCSEERSVGTPVPLSRQIWQQMLVAEGQSQYIEELSGGVREEHRKNTEFLRDKIPPGYPEPYLPYGSLKDPNIDPSLSRKPFLNGAIIELGRKLFAEEKLSFKREHGFSAGVSCASCHQEAQHFADGTRLSLGVEGDVTHRNTPTLLNVAYASTLTWANPAFPLLEMQAKIPLFGDDPVEMGLRGKERDVMTLLLADANYLGLFTAAFASDVSGEPQMDLAVYDRMTAALAAYERTLIDFDTKFDRFLQDRLRLGEAFTDTELLGAKLFYGLEPLSSGETLACARCHSGFLLSNSFHYVRAGTYFNRKSFHNTGMYNTDGKGAYPAGGTGFADARELEEHPEFMGRFRVPSLRFVAHTKPYGHDGSWPNLQAVIQHYAMGGQASASNFGQNPYTDPLVKPGFTIEPREVESLVHFLETLQ